MWVDIRRKIAHWVFREEYAELRQASRIFEKMRERQMQELPSLVNQRVAKTLSQMDPFEPLLKHFHGVFGEEFERPEEKLDGIGQASLRNLGYQLRSNPSFVYLMDWIANSYGNETLKRAPVTPERILYGRAQISSVVLLKREINRLALLYEESLKRPEGFDPSSAVE